MNRIFPILSAALLAARLPAGEPKPFVAEIKPEKPNVGAVPRVPPVNPL